jgi:hypothetical protein
VTIAENGLAVNLGKVLIPDWTYTHCNVMDNLSLSVEALPVSVELVAAAVAALREQWPLTLFGFDVIVDHSGI